MSRRQKRAANISPEEILRCRIVPTCQVWDAVAKELPPDATIVLDTSLLIPTVYASAALRHHGAVIGNPQRQEQHYAWLRELAIARTVAVPRAVLRELTDCPNYGPRRHAALSERNKNVRRALDGCTITHTPETKRPYVDDASPVYALVQRLLGDVIHDSISPEDLEVLTVAAYFAFERGPTHIFTLDRELRDATGSVRKHAKNLSALPALAVKYRSRASSLPLYAPNEKAAWSRKNGA